MGAGIIRTAAELAFIVFLVIGFAKEETFIDFEQKVKKDCLKIREACKRQHISKVLFLKILLLATITPKKNIEQAKQKFYNTRKGKRGN